MSLIYVTGVAGTGKSAVCRELVRRGYTAFDTDDPDIGAPHALSTGLKVVMPPVEERSADWFNNHQWRVMDNALAELRHRAQSEIVYLCGATSDDESLYGLADVVSALLLDDQHIIQRLDQRDGNDYGKSGVEQAFILRRNQTQRQEHRSRSHRLVDASMPLNDVVDEIISASRALRS